MVVDHNDGGCMSSNRRLEDLAHAYLRGTHRALINLHDVQHAVTSVQKQRAQVFLFQQAHFILHERSGIRRRVDTGAFLDGQVQAQSKIEGGLDAHSRCLTDSLDLCQFSGMRLKQTADIILKEGQQFPCDLNLFLPADDSRHEFRQVARLCILCHTKGRLFT
jgi:hypothetical protein